MEKIKHVNIKNVCPLLLILSCFPPVACLVFSPQRPPVRPLCLVTRLSHALRALGDRVGLGETCASIISGGCAGHL